MSTVSQVSDQSFEDAIGSLQASTIAIEKQTRLLEIQRQALETIKSRAVAPNAKGDAKAQQKSKAARERSQIEYECNELANSLQASLRTAIAQHESTSGTLQPNVERVLEKDNRLLDGAEKILPHISNDEDSFSHIQEAERLCDALKALTSADIRARIDAAYLEGAHHYTSQANGLNGKASRETQQFASLNAELDELCREIDGLSTMAVENQYRHPITRANNAAKADSEVEKAVWAEYLSSAIQYSTARMEYLLEQLEDQRAHASAAKTMSAALEEVLAASAEHAGDSQRTSRSPVKQAQKGLKPLRLVQANLSDAQDPASQLLRQLDVRLSGELSDAALAKVTAQKSEGLSALRTSTEHSNADQIAQSLSHADKDTQQLLTAVFAHSKFSTVNLESEQVRHGIDGLEAQTQDLGEKMRTLDVETILKAARSRQTILLENLERT